MKILHIAADNGGSGFYRMFLPAQGLRWLGHDVALSGTAPSDWTKDIDVAIGARVAIPEATKRWQQLKDQGARLILDLDDDYWNLDPTNAKAYQFWTPDLLDSMVENMAVADVVTVCSNELVRRMQERTDTPVQLIPNFLPAQLMAQPRDYRKDKIRIGWAGSSSTVHELKIAARALRKMADRPDVEIVTVGVPAPGVAKAGLRHKNVHTIPWVSEHSEYLSIVSTFDVWVAPYRDISFNRAKFATKALESSMLGIPLIASAITPYAEWIEDGHDGVLVREEHQWWKLLRQLVDDADMREEIGQNARVKASEYVLQSGALQWEGVCVSS